MRKRPCVQFCCVFVYIWNFYAILSDLRRNVLCNPSIQWTKIRMYLFIFNCNQTKILVWENRTKSVCAGKNTTTTNAFNQDKVLGAMQPIHDIFSRLSQGHFHTHLHPPTVHSCQLTCICFWGFGVHSFQNTDSKTNVLVILNSGYSVNHIYMV